jgi:hypothetical protein
MNEGNKRERVYVQRTVGVVSDADVSACNGCRCFFICKASCTHGMHELCDMAVDTLLTFWALFLSVRSRLVIQNPAGNHLPQVSERVPAHIALTQ